MQDHEKMIEELKEQFPDPQKLAAAIEAHCDDVRRDVIPKYYSSEELNDMRLEYVNRATQVSDLKTKKKTEVAKFDGQIKPAEKENAEMLQNIQRGYKEEESNVYDIRDHKRGFVFSYDECGNFLGSRPMKPSERQTVIKHLNTGTE